MSLTTTRVSPVHDRLEALEARFVERNGMAVAASIGESDAVLADAIGITDFSYLYKTGFKGINAAGWAKIQGMVPPRPNGWSEASDGTIFARLANSEFFVEDGAQAAWSARIASALQQMPDGVCPVVRQDAGFALVGERLNDLFVETCSVDFRESQVDSVVMTTMVGVSVLVIRRDIGSRPCYRLWCDPTMAPYLWDTIAEIALGLGGGPVGTDALLVAKPRT